MHRVVLDKWTCEQFFFPEGQDIASEAQAAIDAARAEGLLCISVITYEFLRARIVSDKRPEFDRAMSGVEILTLDQTVVVSLDRIPEGPPKNARLIAATALCSNYQLVTEFPELECDGLNVINAKPVRITAKPAVVGR